MRCIPGAASAFGIFLFFVDVSIGGRRDGKAVVLSGLTITPSISPDAVSGDWTYGGMGGGHLSRTI